MESHLSYIFFAFGETIPQLYSRCYGDCAGALTHCYVSGSRLVALPRPYLHLGLPMDYNHPHLDC
jgi:hypothetical protein